MVNERGILYTIEGLAAGVIMITTAYLILSTTSIYTPGDAHITDLQMEQLGNDVLAVMDTPLRPNQSSSLQIYIETNNKAAFREHFLKLSTYHTGDWEDKIKINASVYFNNKTKGVIDYYPFTDENYSSGNLTGSEHLVKVTRRVTISNNATLPANPHGISPDPLRNQSVLLEVLIWRD
jgi:hypothetical protein